MNKLFFCRFIFYDVGVKSYIFCDWQLHIFFVLWQLNKSMFLVFRFRERAIYHPYASSKVLHFSFPLVYLISLVIFREATLKPKNCLVLSVPLTGIWSTRYLFRMTDGTVSTPFRILPIHAQVASFHISDDSKILGNLCSGSVYLNLRIFSERATIQSWIRSFPVVSS